MTNWMDFWIFNTYSHVIFFCVTSPFLGTRSYKRHQGNAWVSGKCRDRMWYFSLTSSHSTIEYKLHHRGLIYAMQSAGPHPQVLYYHVEICKLSTRCSLIYCSLFYLIHSLFILHNHSYFVVTHFCLLVSTFYKGWEVSTPFYSFITISNNLLVTLF